jgi:ABA DEFICIENT 4-like
MDDPAFLFGLTAGQLYQLLLVGILPAWVLLLLAPRAAITRILVHSIIPALILGGLYGVLIAHGAVSAVPPRSLLGLSGLMALFGTETGLLAGFAHYLVLDLFAGAWQVRDAERRGVPHIAVIPCLLLTFALGPLGLVLYLLIRTAFGRGGLALD